MNLHTLFLLDLDPKEDKYMSGAEAADFLLKKLSRETKAIVCCQLGSDKPTIVYDTLSNLKAKPINKFPQCLIVPGKLHFVEEEALEKLSTN